MVSPDKVAVCLSCGNEWEVRTAGIGKKRKCPLCGKYRVKMKSEVKDDGNKPNPGSKDPVDGAPGDDPVVSTPPAHRVDDKPDHEGDEQRRTKREGSPTPPENSPGSSVNPPEEKSGGEKPETGGGSGIITYAALLLLAVGAGWFLVGLFRRRRAPPVNPEHEEVVYRPRIPAYPGF